MQSIREIYKIGYGPSSSHTIGPVRAAAIFAQKHPGVHKFRVTLYGSLSLTGKGHHTDHALQKEFMPNDLEIVWNDSQELPLHPNGMVFEALSEDTDVVIDSWEVYSIGGGDLRDATGVLNSNKIYSHNRMADILKWCKSEGKSLWEFVEDNEGPEIWPFLHDVWLTMKETIQRGIDNEGVLPGPIKLARRASSHYTKALNAHGTVKNIGLLFAFALAVSEENASGGRIVTSPTCGSSGVLPAVLFYLSRDEHLTEPKILRGLATAGLIANLVKTNASISGAEVGCQGEIGTACAMASAAMAQILGGSPNQIEYAAEMGMEHNLGLTCDPVLGYVQIPCIERNAIAATKAYSCAVYALSSDGGHKISFDKAVSTMAETGRDIQVAYRETGMGGLAKSWEPFSEKK
ncbi:L-serine ammonia-lyase [Perlabentimonas gracilis]|uniref:L-serine ammonia-lyase n=1 Tax=Perlabentimonas gracilis TaxID=2715279 RepID=UPI00140C52F3|nr:L-serine ammonia-lyase [Perlabentimonas gracilis]NHB68960.1 L-serine ammonia-lyase [Perlabentimonas gracilis]